MSPRRWHNGSPPQSLGCVRDRLELLVVGWASIEFIANRRNFHKVEKWRTDGQRIEELLFAGNSLAKAQRIFERFIQKRPRSRLTIRQRTWLLQEWPPVNVNPPLLSSAVTVDL